MPRRLILAVALAAIAAAAVTASALAAPGELPRLTAATPQSVIRDWYDDHSVSGDGHLSWSNQGDGTLFMNTSGIASQREPQSIRFDGTMRVRGSGGLELCGYPSGTTGWMRAYQAEPGVLTGPTCPAVATGPQIGWFRYIYGRHSQTNAFNRWHFMDLERYALVPLPQALGGPPTGTPTVWDNHWGTCLNLLNANPGCETALGAGSLDVGVAAGMDKVTQPHEVDSPLIPIPADLQPDAITGQHHLPAGRYQVVDLMNPYGIVRESGTEYGSVSCVTIDLAWGIPEPHVLYVNTVDANPRDCYVPNRFDGALTEPTGVDPMAGAAGVPACTLPYRNPDDTSHCWPVNPDPEHPNDPPHEGPYIAAHTNSTGDPDVVASTPFPAGTSISAIVAARNGTAPGDSGSTTPPPGGSGGATAPPPSGGTPQPPAQQPPPADDDSPKGTSTSRTTAATARSRTRTALRKVFGTRLSRLKASCRVRASGAATCRVSWRKHGARYSGHVYLRNHRVRGRLRWQYRVDVARHKGHATSRIRRGYRTGGNL
jgi:hypothetical protein